jgi:catechol 2,3-dioxygenase-like lactoylglutathione lyase family enzyme
MELVKPALDVGLFTNTRDAMLAFWQQRVGVPFDETLPIGGGVHQLRHRIGESILKVNHSREALPAAPPSGYRALRLARADVDEPVQLTDPDANRVALVPHGTDGIEQLELTVAVRSLDAHRHFYEQVLRLPRIDADRFACGISIIALVADPTVAQDPPLNGVGYRYTTVQVYDVIAEHARILERGGREGRAPVQLGDVAYISFVRDPDGNWIEISQRYSLLGDR